jgi:hypothetical protein
VRPFIVALWAINQACLRSYTTKRVHDWCEHSGHIWSNLAKGEAFWILNLDDSVVRLHSVQGTLNNRPLIGNWEGLLVRLRNSMGINYGPEAAKTDFLFIGYVNSLDKLNIIVAVVSIVI